MGTNKFDAANWKLNRPDCQIAMLKCIRGPKAAKNAEARRCC